MPSFNEVRDLLPSIVSELLIRHGSEWASLCSEVAEDDPGFVGAVACQYRGSAGFYVILRASETGAARLVSARVLIEPPAAGNWEAIKAERLAVELDEIGSGRHRYLYIPDEAATEARSVFDGTSVSVVPLSSVSRRAV